MLAGLIVLILLIAAALGYVFAGKSGAEASANIALVLIELFFKFMSFILPVLFPVLIIAFFLRTCNFLPH